MKISTRLRRTVERADAKGDCIYGVPGFVGSAAAEFFKDLYETDRPKFNTWDWDENGDAVRHLAALLAADVAQSEGL